MQTTPGNYWDMQAEAKIHVQWPSVKHQAMEVALQALPQITTASTTKGCQCSLNKETEAKAAKF